jgi:hypothetical protein
VLPILHLNGYKIANPTVLARIPRQELEYLLLGDGWQPYFVSGEEPGSMHGRMAQTLDRVFDQIAAIREHARAAVSRPRWPMIVLETPKGWTGPKFVDGVQIEGTWRAHQVPLAEVRTNPQHLRQLEEWMRSYAPTELFEANGAPTAYVRELAHRRPPDGFELTPTAARLAPLKIPLSCAGRRRAAAGSHDERGDAGTGRLVAEGPGRTTRRATSASSRPMKPLQIASMPSLDAPNWLESCAGGRNHLPAMAA